MSPPGAVPHSPGDPPEPTPAGPRSTGPGAAHPRPEPATATTPPAAELLDSHLPAGPPNPITSSPPPAAELPEWERLRVLRAEAEFESVRKDPRIAYALWCGVGIIGGHRFYLGDTGRSIAMLFTLGGLGVWTVVDLFFVGRRVRAVNQSRRAAIMARHGLIDAFPPR